MYGVGGGGRGAALDGVGSGLGGAGDGGGGGDVGAGLEQMLPAGAGVSDTLASVMMSSEGGVDDVAPAKETAAPPSSVSAGTAPAPLPALGVETQTLLAQTGQVPTQMPLVRKRRATRKDTRVTPPVAAWRTKLVTSTSLVAKGVPGSEASTDTCPAIELPSPPVLLPSRTKFWYMELMMPLGWVNAKVALLQVRLLELQLDPAHGCTPMTFKMEPLEAAGTAVTLRFSSTTFAAAARAA